MVRRLRSEDGSILLMSLMILVLMTLAGIAAMNVTSVEYQIAGADKRNMTYAQNAEAGLNYAMATFYKIYDNDDGSGNPIYTHDNDYLTEIKKYDSESTSTTALKHIIPPLAGVKFYYKLKDNAGADTGNALALIEVRCVIKGSSDSMLSSVLSTSAMDVPSISHIAPAPKGYDKTVYCSRLFAITSTALDAQGNPTNIILQKGYYVPAEKAKYESWSVY
jgi:hypothetical protein